MQILRSFKVPRNFTKLHPVLYRKNKKKEPETIFRKDFILAYLRVTLICKHNQTQPNTTKYYQTQANTKK